jgi:hypothetical protein
MAAKSTVLLCAKVSSTEELKDCGVTKSGTNAPSRVSGEDLWAMLLYCSYLKGTAPPESAPVLQDAFLHMLSGPAWCS